MVAHRLLKLPLLLLPLALAAGAAAQPQSVTISAEDCRALVRHEAAPGVAYQPGVDVRGRTVAPADLNPSPITLPETFAFDINVDLFDRLGLPAGGDADYKTSVPVGKVEVTEDRGILFNGQPVGNDAQRQLAERCREVLQRGRR